MRNAGLEEAQAGIKIAGRNTNNPCRWHHFYGNSKEELKSLLVKMQQEREKAQHSKNEDHAMHSHHFMANRWGNNGNSDRLYFLGSKIIADCDCSCEIKRCLFLGIKAMTNLDSILQSRDITLPTKDHLVKVMVFQVVKYGCESWTIKKAECQRISAFKLWHWRKLLIVPWTARSSNQSILKEISPEYSLKGLMLKLKFQYFGHLM